MVFSVDLFILATLLAYSFRMVPPPPPQRISTLMQVSSVGTENFSLYFFKFPS
jgi:hypothetical protein